MPAKKRKTLAQQSACGVQAPKPEGWALSRYPRCNRPVRHASPHREYNKTNAIILHEWEEPLQLTDTALRRYWRSHNRGRA